MEAMELFKIYKKVEKKYMERFGEDAYIPTLMALGSADKVIEAMQLCLETGKAYPRPEREF